MPGLGRALMSEGSPMIYELRTYTLKPGTIGDMVKAASTVSHDIRGNDYGKLEGYWSTEIGPLNQVMHLWSYQDLNERTRLRAELAKNPRWHKEYTPLIYPLLMRQHPRATSTSSATTAPRRGAPSRNGSMLSRRRCLRVRNIPRSSGCGRPRQASRTKSATSGRIPT